MNQPPSELTQAGKSEFWERIIDERLEDYHQTFDGLRVWWPVNYLERKIKLRRIEHSLLRAVEVLVASREADQLLASSTEAAQGDSEPSPSDQSASPLLTIRARANFCVQPIGYLNGTDQEAVL